MGTVKFPELPLEILGQIAGRLREDRLSLGAFALVNWKCRVASIPIAFRSICFTVSTLVTIDRDVGQLAKALSCHGAFRHVRQFNITGNIPEEPPGETYDIDSFQKPGETIRHSWFIGELPEYSKVDIPHRRMADSAYDDNASWKSLASLVGKMSGLTDLTYECSSQFPPCLLDCLHNVLPECRLHIRTFRLHSLMRPEIDPYELQLASSPALASIWTRYDLIYEAGYEAFNDQAAMDMVAGLAPKLREVRLHYVEFDISIDHANRLNNTHSRGEWRGFPGNIPSVRGRLQRLDLVRGPRGVYGINERCIQRWTMVTDFVALRTLRLEDPECSAIRCLATMGSTGALPNLETLILLCPDYIGYASDHEEVDALASLLLSLPALNAFELEGELPDKAYLALLQSHGQALRSLKLKRSFCYEWPPFNADRARVLCAACPNLEELHIPIRRSRGDQDEVEIYKAVASLPRLQIAQLTLDCANTSVWTHDSPRQHGRARGYEPAAAPSDPSFDRFDDQIFLPCLQNGGGRFREHIPRNGHIKQAFINAAVDAQLAFTIWATIFAHRRRHTPNMQPLEKLTLILNRVGEFATPVRFLDKVFEHIGRSWTVKQSVRDDEPFSATVEPYRLGRYEYSEIMPLPPHITRILRRLWPGAFGERKDWRYCWHSFPLAGTRNEELWPQIVPSEETVNRPRKFDAAL